MSFPTPMDDGAWLALCVYDEASNQPEDGMAAVAKVVLNRAREHYFSDGTIKGTILRKDQFSGFYFSMVDGKYRRVCKTMDEAEARALLKYDRCRSHPVTWATCHKVALEVLNGAYKGGPDYQKLGDDALLYVNLAVVRRPAWAKPEKLIVKIADHSFFRA